MAGFAVAIDGPGGAGKSTVARLLARALGFVYIDTGAMYRAVALFCIDNCIPFEQSALERALDAIDIHITHVAGEQRIFLNGADVTAVIRTQLVAEGSSKVAAFAAVREKLVTIQRGLAADTDVIMDGRDIGTAVLPFADLKIYLDAGVEQRARRRQAELLARGIPSELERTKQEVLLRDDRDINRAFSPLRRAEDAVLIDTSDMTLDEVKDRLLALVSARRERSKNGER